MDKLNEQNQNWLDDNTDIMYQEDESNTIIRKPHEVVLVSDVKQKLLEMQSQLNEANKRIAELGDELGDKHCKLHEALKIRDKANEQLSKVLSISKLHNMQPNSESDTGCIAVKGKGYYMPSCDYLMQQDKIAELEQAQEWVSVNDRLPEIDDRVLIYKPKSYNKIISTHRCYKERKAGNGALFFNESKHYGGVATHWMPLPPQPKEQ
jgi:hypothetical protein